MRSSSFAALAALPLLLLACGLDVRGEGEVTPGATATPPAATGSSSSPAPVATDDAGGVLTVDSGDPTASASDGGQDAAAAPSTGPIPSPPAVADAATPATDAAQPDGGPGDNGPGDKKPPPPPVK